jgi:hypothetical protein
MLSGVKRALLIDKVASLVDENVSGRSDMCIQFADLLSRALKHVSISARAALGICIYYQEGKEIFRWKHAWVRAGEEIIDGNVDALDENPLVPPLVKVRPYWGLVNEVPRDRRLREERGATLPPDSDITTIWWPELKAWLDSSTEWKST